jgi:class 3 adenylate cyclase
MVLAGEGEDLPGAIAELRRAVKLWTDADLPFEAAVSRRWLAIACQGTGDMAAASLELGAARSAFQKLGARLEAARCDELEAAWSAGGDGRRVTRTFVFTDIVGSTNLLETMGDEAWEDVSRWHDETLRTLIEQHRGEVVHPTGDGFFATFADAGSAASCAVAIQRRLADHRRQHGFAPQVRIGMHAAEATAVGDDYAGIGVHEAARVGALADGGEILVTFETLDREPIVFPITDERTVELKGIAQPVRVARIEWKAT